MCLTKANLCFPCDFSNLRCGIFQYCPTPESVTFDKFHCYHGEFKQQQSQQLSASLSLCSTHPGFLCVTPTFQGGSFASGSLHQLFPQSEMLFTHFVLVSLKHHIIIEAFPDSLISPFLYLTTSRSSYLLYSSSQSPPLVDVEIFMQSHACSMPVIPLPTTHESKAFYLFVYLEPGIAPVT